MASPPISRGMSGHPGQLAGTHGSHGSLENAVVLAAFPGRQTSWQPGTAAGEAAWFPAPGPPPPPPHWGLGLPVGKL